MKKLDLDLLKTVANLEMDQITKVIIGQAVFYQVQSLRFRIYVRNSEKQNSGTANLLLMAGIRIHRFLHCF